MMRSLAFKLTQANQCSKYKKIFNKYQLRRFSEQKTDNKKSKIIEQENELVENKSLSEHKYIYDPLKFQEINSESFLKKLEQIEKANQPRPNALESIGFPLFLVLTSLFIYHLWTTCPYSVVYKHCTISEYIPQKQYYHAIFLGINQRSNTQ